jgi:phage terminase large subunit-like protein
LAVLDKLKALSPQARAALLTECVRKIDSNKLADYLPYPKQRDFHASGGPLHVRERLLKAGNQVGKTWSAGFEHAMHLTGRYPDWWPGATFDEPTIGWAASETSQGTRDTVQRILLGQVGSWGTGAIPRDAIKEIKRAAHGVPDAVETVLVRHGGGGDVQAGTSRITIKTYDQGRLRWQGETLDFVWFDEEPPEDIYFEGLTRTNARGGIVTLTFTPLKGMSEVVRRFLQEKPAGTVVTNMTIHDAAHYTPEQREAIIATYPAHEREARINGTPTLGSGRIYQHADEAVAESQIAIPSHWPRIAGMDFGWDHKTAVVWLAWDRDSDTIHLYDAYGAPEQTPMVHSIAIKARGDWIPMAWPSDGLQHEKGTGDELKKQYLKYGVKMLVKQATHAPDHTAGQKEGEGGNSVELGITEINERILTGRFKVAKHLNDWFEEYRLYHRKDGKIVKLNDDFMDATRYAVMMLRHAKTNTQPQRKFAPGHQITDPATGVLG